jgi:3-phosphoshikimate 1-carboxyvinyltransferase
MISGIGGKIEKTDDGLIITPVPHFTGGTVDSFNDHRIAMAAAIAATASTGNVTVRGFESIRKSYPDFLKDYINLGGKTENGITLE